MITTEITTVAVSTELVSNVIETNITAGTQVTTTLAVVGPQGAQGVDGVSIVPYVSDTPPDPDEHPLWLDSTTATLYFWYEDADSSQWVSITGGTGAPGADGLDAPAYARRHDYAAPYSYCGKAVDGSLDSDPVWTITRIELASDGTTTVTHAYDVAWDDRLTATYG